MSEKKTVYCDFCGEDSDNRRVVIAAAANGVHICDVCVFVSMTIIASPKDDRDAMLRDVKAASNGVESER